MKPESTNAAKRRAHRAGVSVNEYFARTGRGEKYCSTCGRWRKVSKFTRHAARHDGLSPTCAECISAARNERNRERRIRERNDMAQTEKGAALNRARKAGVTVNQLLALTEAGQKFCTKCQKWHPTSNFYRDMSRFDNLQPICRGCHSDRAKRKYREKANG